MRAIVACLSLLALANPAWGQSAGARAEIFGGYSMLPADRGSDFPRRMSHGFQVSASGNLTNWFGVFAELAIQWNINRDVGPPPFEGLVARTRVTHLLIGPRFTARSERIELFVHGLVGTGWGDGGDTFSGFSDSGPAFGGGIGMDVRLRDRLAVRGQFDLLASFTDIVEGNARAAIGLAVGFGGS